MRDVKYSLDWLLKTKADLMKMLESSRRTLERAKEDVEIWEMMVNDVDTEIAEIQQQQRSLRQASGMVRIGVIIISVLVIVTLIIFGAK